MSERRFKRDREKRLVREERRRARLKRAAILGGAAFGVGAFAAPVAQATTFTVSNLTDSAPGSLRDAVDDANANSGADDVVFQSGLSGQITLTTGEVTITEALAVHGPGASVLAVSGNGNDRVFKINPYVEEAPVSIAGLTVTDGYAATNGGGINNIDADFTLSDSVITDSAAGVVDDGFGGGISTGNHQTTIERSTISGNDAYGGSYGGGIGTDGGTIVVRDSTVTGNSAAHGGGIAFYDMGEEGFAESRIERSTISGNDAS